MAGRDGIHHDQKDVGRARRRHCARLLAGSRDPVANPGRRREDRDQDELDRQRDEDKPPENGVCRKDAGRSRSHAPAWERLCGRSCGPCAAATRSVAGDAPTRERGSDGALADWAVPPRRAQFPRYGLRKRGHFARKRHQPRCQPQRNEHQRNAINLWETHQCRRQNGQCAQTAPNNPAPALRRHQDQRASDQSSRQAHDAIGDGEQPDKVAAHLKEVVFIEKLLTNDDRQYLEQPSGHSAPGGQQNQPAEPGRAAGAQIGCPRSGGRLRENAILIVHE